MDIRSLRPVNRYAWLIALAALAGGCARIERTMTLHTQPEGALVYLNGQEIGRTPVDHNFTWYGNYDLQARMDGYETLKVKQPVVAPWWQWVPIDLAAEFIPARMVDHHEYSYSLKPQPESQPEQMIQAASALRSQLESGEFTRQPSPSTRPSSRPATRPSTRPTAQATTAPATPPG